MTFFIGAILGITFYLVGFVMGMGFHDSSTDPHSCCCCKDDGGWCSCDCHDDNSYTAIEDF